MRSPIFTRHGGAEQRRDLCSRKWRDQHAIAGRCRHIESRTQHQRCSTAFQGNVENQQRQREQDKEADERHSYVWKLLAKKKFDPGHRCDVEIRDRTEFLFPDDGQRHQDRGNQD